MPRGGIRRGAGRPKGHQLYGESTTVMRVPASRVTEIRDYLQDKSEIPRSNDPILVPFYGGKVAAGMPSPSDDYIEAHIDLNTHLIRNPEATFIVRATGDSMINAGIFQDDMLIVDRGVPALNGKIVVVAIDGELTVKRIQRKDSKLLFLPENDAYTPIDATSAQSVVIWGVVTKVIHAV